MDAHMPKITFKPKHPPCPWLKDNEELTAIMRERDLARINLRDNPSQEARDLYRACRNRVKSAFSRARTAFFLSSYERSRTGMWKDIRKFLISPKGQKNTQAGPEVEHWADQLNAHFAAVGPNVAAELQRWSGEALNRCPRARRVW